MARNDPVSEPLRSNCRRRRAARAAEGGAPLAAPQPRARVSARTTRVLARVTARKPSLAGSRCATTARTSERENDVFSLLLAHCAECENTKKQSVGKLLESSRQQPLSVYIGRFVATAATIRAVPLIQWAATAAACGRRRLEGWNNRSFLHGAVRLNRNRRTVVVVSKPGATAAGFHLGGRLPRLSSSPRMLIAAHPQTPLHARPSAARAAGRPKWRRSCARSLSLSLSSRTTRRETEARDRLEPSRDALDRLACRSRPSRTQSERLERRPLKRLADAAEDPMTSRDDPPVSPRRATAPEIGAVGGEWW